ncbi:myeloid-associated differentiation marker-like protein 2 [Trichomycterus rosablanca]|uniref:myeloid-associated differentiation marker-like protein 2 n=1 Tax=Trichomycterus rosablanca TaxID=2290929 RepID=UPI002F35CA85
MSPCCPSLSTILRILEALFCGLALLIPMIRGWMRNPYGVWCEFVWLLGLAIAVAIFFIEKFLCDKLFELIVLQHSWTDLTCGLSLQMAVMLLSASALYFWVFVCKWCMLNIFCAIFSTLAFIIYTLDAVKAKVQCPEGYLSSIRGLLRFGQAFVACITLTALADYFMHSMNRFSMPPPMAWCIVVYVVCFLASVLIILIQLIKLLRGLVCCFLDKLEMVFDIIAVVLYGSAAIIFPIYAYKHYWSHHDHKYNIYNQSLIDLHIATVLTYVNLGLYVVDLIWLLIASCRS